MKKIRSKWEMRGVKRHTRFTMVGICLQLSLSQLEVLLGNDLVERVGAASEFLAGVAMAV